MRQQRSLGVPNVGGLLVYSRITRIGVGDEILVIVNPGIGARTITRYALGGAGGGSTHVGTDMRAAQTPK
jgi:hypothetical protein